MATFPEDAAPGGAVPAPALAWRGLVEGFYGPPWSFGQRLDQLRFVARHGGNAYVYAPKDDPLHRAQWRRPYPPADRARIADLAAAAAGLGVRFVVALAPGLTMRYDDPAEQELLHVKIESLWSAGVRHFALLFDDIPGFRADDRDLGAAHGTVAARLADAVLIPRGAPTPLLVCPADYAGVAPSPYRDGLASTLPPDAVITWSGPGVVSAAVSAEDVSAALATYRRSVLLWDNVPVNDFDRARLHLGPLRHRPAVSRLAGLLANPMIEPVASRITLATALEYAAAPASYDPDAALERALAGEAAADAARLAPLAAASGWPPDADTGSELRPLTEAALGGDRAAARELRGRLRPLAEVPEVPAPGPLAAEAEPWLRAGRALARAAVDACDLLLHGPGDDRVAAGHDALEDAEEHWPNVQRDVLSPFVRTVLHRAALHGAVPPPAPDTAPYALVIGGDVPTAGEERLMHLLRRHGLVVRRSAVAAAAPALVVVSRSAPERAAIEAAALPVPLLGLFHLGATGLARRSGVLLREERVRIVAPGHPLAAGRTGAVRVYRGPAMSRWAEPGPGGRVVACAEEEDRPVIVHYPRGADLADGTPAAAPRAALFLGRDLLAPWVITPHGVELVDAAIRHLLAPATDPDPDRDARPTG
jgi:hypothetical protein